MTHDHVKGATDKAKGAFEDSSKKQPPPEFDKPLGSSHDDRVRLEGCGTKGSQKVTIITPSRNCDARRRRKHLEEDRTERPFVANAR